MIGRDEQSWHANGLILSFAMAEGREGRDS